MRAVLINSSSENGSPVFVISESFFKNVCHKAPKKPGSFCGPIVLSGGMPPRWHLPTPACSSEPKETVHGRWPQPSSSHQPGPPQPPAATRSFSTGGAAEGRGGRSSCRACCLVVAVRTCQETFLPALPPPTANRQLFISISSSTYRFIAAPTGLKTRPRFTLLSTTARGA